MFGKSKQKLETIIGNETCLKGELITKGTVRVDGSVEGNVEADWVIVGGTGRVKGDVKARGVIVGGRIEGNVDADEVAELKDKGTVVGEIHAERLAVAEGAVFEGHSCMKGRNGIAAGSEGQVISLKSPPASG